MSRFSTNGGGIPEFTQQQHDGVQPPVANLRNVGSGSPHTGVHEATVFIQHPVIPFPCPSEVALPSGCVPQSTERHALLAATPFTRGRRQIHAVLATLSDLVNAARPRRCRARCALVVPT